MDDEIKQILSFLNMYLQSKLNAMNIGNIKWDALHFNFQEVPKINKYDDFKLNDFLTLYKINRLTSLNIINDKTANKLKTMFYFKKKLLNMLETLVIEKDIEGNKESIDKICKKIIKIDEKLKKYNLTNIKLDLTKIIDNDIINENYINLSKEQLQIYNELINKEDDSIDTAINYLDTKIEENKKNKIR